MICIDDNPSIAASSPRHLWQQSSVAPCTPGCSSALAGTKGGLLGGIAAWDGVCGGIWGMPCVRGAVARKGLQRGSCWNHAQPQSGAGRTHSTILQCSALLPLQGKGNPKSPRDQQPAAGTQSLPGAAWTWVLQDAHPHFNPNRGQGRLSSAATNGSLWPGSWDLSPRQGSSGCTVPQGSSPQV